MTDETLAPQALREAVREVLADRQTRLGDRIPDERGREFDHALWTTATELGWLALPIGAAHGGLGLGPAHIAALQEELGRALASAPIASTLLAADAIATDPAVAGAWLPRIARGEVRAAIALPDGPDALGCDGGRLSGVVHDMLDAADATLLLLPVEGGSIALVEADAPGVAVERGAAHDLTRSLATVRLDRVVPTAVLAPAPADRERLRDRAALAVASDAVGGAQAILARTADYMCVRTQFGRPIGSFQALKHRAAHWAVQLDAATALVRHAAAAVAADADDSSWLASGAKALATDTYVAIAEDAIQLHGGIGFTWDHVCHLHLRRARLDRLLFGSARAHKERVAQLAFTPPGGHEETVR